MHATLRTTEDKGGNCCLQWKYHPHSSGDQRCELFQQISNTLEDRCYACFTGENTEAEANHQRLLAPRVCSCNSNPGSRPLVEEALKQRSALLVKEATRTGPRQEVEGKGGRCVLRCEKVS